MKLIILFTSAVLALFSSQSFADACLNTDKRGDDGDARHYDYVACKPSGVAGGQRYNSLSIIGGQMADIMSRRSEDNGYSDAEREANLQAIRSFVASEAKRRADVKYGALMELTSGSNFAAGMIYPNANIPQEQQRAIRNEISSAISAGKLLETYGNKNYADVSVWQVTDPVERWKNCEVATVLSQAYLTGELATPAQINREKGYAIAQTGSAQKCGGTAYWHGRVFEEGDDWVKGVDKELGKSPKYTITWQFDVAIINGFSPAYQRLADLLRLGGPARYRGKKYFDLMEMSSYSYWLKPKSNDESVVMLLQYRKCLDAEPANLECAQQLRDLYANKNKDFLTGYSTYNADLATYYDGYVKELQKLMASTAR